MLHALSAEERTDLIMSVGLHKKDRRRKPVEVAELIEKAATKQSLEEIAEDVELRSDDMLRRFLALKRLPTEIQDLVHWGANSGFIPFSAAVEMSRLDDDDDMAHLSRKVLEFDLTKEEVRAVVQRVKRGKVDVDSATDEITKMRPLIERHHLFLGVLSRTMLRDKDESQIRQALRRALARTVGAENLLSVACRQGRFSFVLNDQAMNDRDIRDNLRPENLEQFVHALVSGQS